MKKPRENSDEIAGVSPGVIHYPFSIINYF